MDHKQSEKRLANFQEETLSKIVLVEKVVCIHLVTKGDMKLVADRFHCICRGFTSSQVFYRNVHLQMTLFTLYTVTPLLQESLLFFINNLEL